MKFSLVFENSGDTLPFVARYNQDLLAYFVDSANKQDQNAFFNHHVIQKEIDQKVTDIHWAISKTNEVLYDLVGVSFEQHTELSQYLEQDFLNKTHCDWVQSQSHSVDIDRLRHSANRAQAHIGNRLHDMYPDDERFPKIADVLEKLGYIYAYEQVNMSVHRLESLFNKTNLEFRANKKWQVFDNPFKDSMTSNNDVVNFAFGYTYVGRQYYNKFTNFDTELRYADHYNYEQLEFAFQLTLQRPETIAWSTEMLDWSQHHNVKPVAEQIPIGNLENLEEKLFDYRKVLYRNSRDNNQAKIFIRG